MRVVGGQTLVLLFPDEARKGGDQLCVEDGTRMACRGSPIGGPRGVSVLKPDGGENWRGSCLLDRVRPR